MRNAHLSIGLAAAVILALGSTGIEAQVGRGRGRAAVNTDARMTGTYELEITRGGDPERAAEAATRALPAAQRDRAYQSLVTRLEPPRLLSLSRHGNVITIASDRGAQSSFTADGRTQRERDLDGRMVNSRAELLGDRLMISTEGGTRGTDFSVAFEALANGDTLRVTRRLGDENVVRPVSIESYYRRISTTPEWDLYDDRVDPPRAAVGRGTGRTMTSVPDGTRLVATLDTPISMRDSRDGEPFTMTVQTPGEYQGARIDGVLSRVRDTQGNGMDLRFAFDQIEAGGQSAQFDAVVNTIRLLDGRTLHITDEGDMRQTGGGNTVRNGTIGAAVGAIIGAIAGGGKGALIGAAVGGAGGVIVSQGRETLEIPRGAQIALTAVR